MAHLYRTDDSVCELHSEAVALADAVRLAGVSANRCHALDQEEWRALAVAAEVRARFWQTPAETLAHLVLEFRLLVRTEWYDGRWPETGTLHSDPIDSVNKAEAEAALMDLERIAGKL